MRPGLVGSGAGLLTLGGLLVVAAFASPGPAGHETSHLLRVELPGGSPASTYLYGDNGSYGAFAVAWRSSAPVAAVLSETNGCSGSAASCTPGTAVESWPTNASGAWSTSAPAGTVWLLRFSNPGSTTVTLLVSSTSSVASPQGGPFWATAVELVGAATLGAVGAVALFLGLFLRAGIYRRSPAPPDAPLRPPGAH